MPIDFGDIIHYNKRIAARYYLQAQIERNRGDDSQASFHADVAARYLQAAHEQRLVMSSAPGRPIEAPRSRLWFLEPKSASKQGGNRTALRRLFAQFAAAVRQSLARRSSPLQSLSLN